MYDVYIGKDVTEYAATNIKAGPLHVISSAQDSIVSASKNIKTVVTSNNPSNYTIRTDSGLFLLFKYNGFTQRVLTNEIFFIDVNEDSFTDKTLSLSPLNRISSTSIQNRRSVNMRRSSLTSSNIYEENVVSSIFPMRERSKDSISVYLCKTDDMTNNNISSSSTITVVGATSIYAALLHDKQNISFEVKLESEIGNNK
jgi:hypothetical protein